MRRGCALGWSENCSPYSFAHWRAGNQSSFAVRSLTLPNTGRGFGPGGSDPAEALDFLSQMKTARRRLAEAARTGVEGMVGKGKGKGGEMEEGTEERKNRRIGGMEMQLILKGPAKRPCNHVSSAHKETSLLVIQSRPFGTCHANHSSYPLRRTLLTSRATRRMLPSASDLHLRYHSIFNH